MNSSKMLQRNGRLTNLSAYGALPHYDRQLRNLPAVYPAQKCGCADGAQTGACPCNKSNSLAIAGIQTQQWRDIYDLEKGFQSGTIFRQLDLPFLGMRGVQRL